MFKKFIAVFASSVIAAGIFCVFPACSDGDGGKPEDPPKANYTLKDEIATISWEEVDGCEGYMVQKSPSRFGTYEDIDYVEGKTQYVTDDIYAYYRIAAYGKDGNMTRLLGPYSFDLETFGNSTYVFAPTDNMQLVQESLNEFYLLTDGTVEDGRARGEFTNQRYSALFKKGEYDIDLKVGYYTSISGLGASPDDATISKMTVSAPISLCNFWRTAENISFGSNTVWAVSQATSLRRVHIKGDLALSADKATSGGFLADVKVDGTVNSGSQQQWLSRNSQFGSWNGGVWNMAFVGVDGKIPADRWGGGAKYTNIETSGNLREKPFITFDEENGYRVFVPDAATAAKGVSDWSNKNGEYIPLSDFYVARSDRDTAETINTALNKGKHILFSAGVYELNAPINVTKPDTIVMGLGLATLRPSDKNNETLIKTADADGIKISGLLLDAGKNTESLLEVGEEGAQASHAQNPISLNDVFFRVGGAEEKATSVDVCAVINSNDVIGDNFWIWRADHWDGVGWDKNVAKNGIIINGDNATFYGLFVEHFLEYQTIWNGNGGTTYFYQSELPYDVPSQSGWMSHGGTVNGYSSYKVSDNVTSHKAYALGVYSYLRDAEVRLENAIECPRADGVAFKHIITVFLNGNDKSGINHVINGEGDAVEKGKMLGGLEFYPAAE
ncbi:MAG: hypothetical protein K2L42_05900 [Clostridia bacterium]|nr:hypothetical protein [Clostridia bacterium]